MTSIRRLMDTKQLDLLPLTGNTNLILKSTRRSLCNIMTTYLSTLEMNYALFSVFLTMRLHHVPGYHNADTTLAKEAYRGKVYGIMFHKLSDGQRIFQLTKAWQLRKRLTGKSWKANSKPQFHQKLSVLSRETRYHQLELPSQSYKTLHHSHALKFRSLKTSSQTRTTDLV